MRTLLSLVLLASGVAAQQFLDVSRQHLVDRNRSTLTCAAGDIDRDGDLDILLGGEAGGRTLRWFENLGTARFVERSVAASSSDWVFGCALFDADGDLDLDVCAVRGGYDALYLNNGAGVFTDATTGRLPVIWDDGREVAAIDVDGDHDLDLVVANISAGNRLLRNDGTGVFTDVTAAQLPPTGLASYTLEAGDLDRDGDLDLIFGNDGKDSVMRNDGAGTFVAVPPASLPWGAVRTESTALADVDRDGDLDLFAATVSAVFLYRNDGGSAWSDASGNLPSPTPRTGRLEAGDIDGDGAPDLVIGTDFLTRSVVLHNDGTGRFTDVSAAALPESEGQEDTRALLLRDFDGDGNRDLLLGGHTPSLGNLLYLNDGNGRFQDGSRTQLPSYPFGAAPAMALADVDGDRIADLMIAGGSNANNRLLLGRVGGFFVDVTTRALPRFNESTTAVVVGDVDGDHDLDAVFGNYNYPKRLLLNDGAGVFVDVTSTHLNVVVDWNADVALLDVDRDGDLDLVAAVDGQDRLFRNDGSGHFTDVTSTDMPVDSSDSHAVAVADVDADGDLDLAFGNGDSNSREQSRLYLNDGTGRFTDVSASRLPVLPGETSDIEFVDVDGDHDLDLLLASVGSPDNVGLWRNDGRGFFVDVTATQIPAFVSGYRLLPSDLDSDGDVDVVVVGIATFLLNDGRGFFARALGRLPTPGNWVAADLEGDGDADLVDLTVPLAYANAWRQAFTPLIPAVGRPFALQYFAEAGAATVPQPVLAFLGVARLGLPFDWPGLGRLWLDPSQSLALPVVFTSVPSGRADLTLNVPLLASLRGLHLYTQALVLGRITNATADVIQ